MNFRGRKADGKYIVGRLKVNRRGVLIHDGTGWAKVLLMSVRPADNEIIIRTTPDPNGRAK